MTKEKEKYNSEINKEDKKALGDISGNLRNDDGEDSVLQKRKKPVDFTGKDLDVPGRVLPSNKTKKKLKDEENQLYGLGSEHNENLESTEDLE